MISVVIMGDQSKYSFLGEIVQQIPIPKTKMGDTDIIVTQFDTNGGTASNRAIELKSARLPIATKVVFPSNNANVQDYADKAAAVLYFEEFGFLKSSSLKELESICEAKFPSVTVVLYIPQRNFLESDISTYDEDIETARAKYKEDGYTVIEYTPGTSMLPLVVQLPSDISANCHRDRVLDKITKKKELLYDEDVGVKFDYEYTREVCECSLSEHDRLLITRYDKQEFERASLDVVYFERARKLIFEKKRSTLVEPLLGVYKNFINNPDFKEFIFWDMEKDVQILEKIIKTKFYESIFVNHNTIFQGTPIEYGMYEEKNKLCLEFYNRIETFFRDTFCEAIVQHIDSRLTKLEKLAKGEYYAA